MAKKIRIHLHIASTTPAAPHMVSGEPSGAAPLARVMGPIGRQGQAYRMACDPAIIQSQMDMATNEWWNVRCEECFQTDAFKTLAKSIPHPLAPIEDDSAVAAMQPGCCG